MKKIIFGLIATVMFSFNGIASNDENPIKGQITIETQVKDKLNKKITFTINFDSIADLEKFDVNNAFLNVEVESCTACVTINIAGSGGEVCATAATCKRALAMLKELVIAPN